MQEIECKVTGRVQAVTFRDFVMRKARGLGIVGEAENLEDHSMRVIAQGTDEQLQKLIEHLHKGPFLARVRDVDVVWREPREKYNDFKIKY